MHETTGADGASQTAASGFLVVNAVVEKHVVGCHFILKSAPIGWSHRRRQVTAGAVMARAVATPLKSSPVRFFADKASQKSRVRPPVCPLPFPFPPLFLDGMGFRRWAVRRKSKRSEIVQTKTINHSIYYNSKSTGDLDSDTRSDEKQGEQP